MNVIFGHLRRLVGVEDAFKGEEFNGEIQKSRIRVKVAVGAATIAGLALVVISLITSSAASIGNTADIPLELTPSTAANFQEGSNPLGTVLIHVIGEVISPGIYELDSGSRVIDAVMAAGGLSSSASDCGVNLAREVKDGEQIVIPAQSHDCSEGSAEEKGTLSLNSATVEQFDSLPGIGPTLAERIVQWRSTNNAFTSIDQLNEVSGIGDKLFLGIKDLVTL